MVIKMKFNSKIIIIDNKIMIIEYYENIKFLSIDQIIIDNIEIFGLNLKIKKMDDYSIEIHGQISKVFIESDENKWNIMWIQIIVI